MKEETCLFYKRTQCPMHSKHTLHQFTQNQSLNVVKGKVTVCFEICIKPTDAMWAKCTIF